MAQKNKRRKFFQKEIKLYKSIFSFFIISGLGIAILATLYIFVSSMIISMIVEEGAIQSVAGPDTLMGKILISYWFYIIIGGIFLILLSMFFTHRFAGPLYRFEVSIDRMIDKDIGFGIKIRKRDECRTLAQKLNEFNIELANTINQMKDIVTEIDEHQIGLYKESGGKSKTLKRAIVLNRDLQKILNEYKCS